MRSTYKQFYYINRGRVKADGTTSIFCRITIDGKVSAIATGLYCAPEEWDTLNKFHCCFFYRLVLF